MFLQLACQARVFFAQPGRVDLVLLRRADLAPQLLERGSLLGPRAPADLGDVARLLDQGEVLRLRQLVVGLVAARVRSDVQTRAQH